MKRRSLGKKKGGISPYKKYGKKPYVYSVQHQRWRRDPVCMPYRWDEAALKPVRLT